MKLTKKILIPILLVVIAIVCWISVDFDLKETTHREAPEQIAHAVAPKTAGPAVNTEASSAQAESPEDKAVATATVDKKLFDLLALDKTVSQDRKPQRDTKAVNYVKWYAEQRALLKAAFSSDIDVAYRKQLVDYLKSTEVFLNNEHRSADAALKNDILEALIEEGGHADELAAIMLDITSSEDVDPLWQEYTMQLYATLLVSDGSNDLNFSQKQKLISSLNQATVQGRESGMAGTALLDLEKITRKADKGSRTRVGSQAYEVVKDENSSIPSKVSAMQVLGKTGSAQNKSLIESIALDSTEDVTLRMTAIAALANLGVIDSRMATELQKLSSSRDPRLRNAARAALSKTNNKS